MAGMKDREDLLLSPAAKLREQQLTRLEGTEEKSFLSQLGSTGSILTGIGALGALLAGEEELALGLTAGGLTGVAQGAERINTQRQAAITGAEDGLIEQMNLDTQRAVNLYNIDKSNFAAGFTGNDTEASAMFGLPDNFKYASVWRDQIKREANQARITVLDGMLDSVRDTGTRADIMEEMYLLKGFVAPYEGYFDKIAQRRQTYEDFLALSKQTDISFISAVEFLKGKDTNDPDVIDHAIGLLSQNKSAHVVADAFAREKLTVESDIWATIFQVQDTNPGMTVDDAFQSLPTGMMGDAMALGMSVEADRWAMITKNAQLPEVQVLAGELYEDVKAEWELLNPSETYPMPKAEFVQARVYSAITQTLGAMNMVNQDISQSTVHQQTSVVMKAAGIELGGRKQLTTTEQRVVTADMATMNAQFKKDYEILPLETKRLMLYGEYVAARTAELSGSLELQKKVDAKADEAEDKAVQLQGVDEPIVIPPDVPTVESVLGITEDQLSDDPILREGQLEQVAEAGRKVKREAKKVAKLAQGDADRAKNVAEDVRKRETANEERRVKQAVAKEVKDRKVAVVRKHRAVTNDDWLASESFANDGEVRTKVVERIVGLTGKTEERANKEYTDWIKLEARRSVETDPASLAKTMLEHLLGGSNKGKTAMTFKTEKG